MSDEKYTKTLFECYDYDPTTGEIRHKKARQGAIVGRLVRNPDKDGYYRVNCRVDGYEKVFKAHRVAWLLYYGEWPEGQIDHINFDKKDNRIANLRVVGPETNSAVRPLKERALPRGVNLNGNSKKRPFKASIHDKTIRKGRILGSYESPQAAHAAYVAAFIALHGEPPPPCKPRQIDAGGAP